MLSYKCDVVRIVRNAFAAIGLFGIACCAPPGASAAIVDYDHASVLVALGDSVTYGQGTHGVTSCGISHVAHVATGTCWLDLLGERHRVKVANLGIPATCLEATKTGGYCTNPLSFYNRYRADFGPFVADRRAVFVIMGGSNDMLAADIKPDAEVSAALYGSQYADIVAWLISRGVGRDRIVLSAFTPVAAPRPPSAPSQRAFEDEVRATANAAHVAYADPYAPLAPCWQVAPPPCKAAYSIDGNHPDDLGSVVIADTLDQAVVMP